MKKGGSAALAAMLRSRSEVIQAGGNPAPPPTLVALAPPAPLAENEMPKTAHPAARALEDRLLNSSAPAGVPPPPSRPAPPSTFQGVRSVSPTPAVRAVSPNPADRNAASPLLISHPKRNFSPNPLRSSTSPTPAARDASPTPVLRSTQAPAQAPRSVSPVAATHQPKVIAFSGAHKCYVCDKTVYKTEEVIAVGHTWHDKCFTCGGKAGEGGCGRVLRRDGYVDHSGEPYCQACYNKLYRPKGFSVSANINTDYGTSGSPAPAPASVPAPPARPAAPPAAPPVAEVRNLSLAPSSAPARPTPPAKSPSAHLTANTANTLASAVAPSGLGGGSKCSICTKTVYKMEEVLALGRIWHNSCFTCGGINGDGCQKVLKRDNYVDHDNQPYCQPCYARLFGPKTFGHGNAGEMTVPNGSGIVAESAAPSSTSTAPRPPTPSAPAPPSAPPSAPPARPAPPAPAAPGMTKAQAVTGKVAIGSTSKAATSTSLYQEAGYIGENDEVDESEW